jgi:hypothetical protein
MTNNMYRVSSNQVSTLRGEMQQCGSLYYFATMEAACVACKEFGTGIVVMPYCSQTDKHDDYYK